MPQKYEKHGLSTLSELNVTPLLDLAFVLLIIFMITAPFLAESADVTIPTSKASRQAVDPSKVLVVSVDKNHSFSLDGEPVSPDRLGPELARIKAEQPELAVVIRSDRELAVQKIIDVMDLLKSAGVTKIGIVTKPDG